MAQRVKAYALQPQDQYKLRLPDGMRDELKTAAARNNRSMNAEMVARLAVGGSQLDRIEAALERIERQIARLAPSPTIEE